MLYLYHGTPGSGKSYHAVQDIYDCLHYNRNGINIIANFPVDVKRAFYTNLGWLKYSLAKKFPKLHFDRYNSLKIQERFWYVPNDQMTVDYLIRFCLEHHRFQMAEIDGREEKICPEDQTIVVLDEAQILFNCRGWQDQERQKWCEFFSMHRHFGFNIILLAQNERMLDRQIRYQIEMFVAHKNLKYFNWFAKLLSLLCGGSLFLMLYRWQGCPDIMKRSACRYRPRIASIYNSYRVFSAGTDTSTGEGPRGRDRPSEILVFVSENL